MSPSRRIFLGVFLFSCGAVGVALALLNATAEPSSTTAAVVFGAGGLLALAAAATITRWREY